MNDFSKQSIRFKFINFYRIVLATFLLSSLLTFGQSSVLPIRAEMLRESNRQATYPVVVTWIGYTVNNEVTISVSGLGVVVSAENIWDGVFNSRTYYSPNPNPAVGVSILHVTDSRSGADCPGGSPNTALRYTGCFEDDVDMDYNDLIYTVTYPDTTPPTTTHALSGTLGNNGYYKSAVALALAAVDTESGVASTKLNGATYTTPLIITTESTTTHSYYSTDIAGNVEVTKTVSVKIDTVAPATTASLTGLMGLNSWFVGPVNVSLMPTDFTSGVASSTLNGSAYTGPVSFSAQGTNSITYFSTDNAGNNETTQNASFKVDTIAPQASIALECPSSGDNGWCKSPLTVNLTGSDFTSGMESLIYNYNGETKTITGGSATFNSGVGGTSTVTLYAIDKSGQRSATQSQEIKIDGAPPTIEFRGATQTALFFRFSDGDSGVKSWTLQVFNAQGQSVFYKDGTGAFDGELAWSPSLGASGGGKLFKMLPQSNQFKINLFAKDNAGHENGVQQASFTLNQIATAQPTATATTTPLPRIVVAVQPTKIPTATQVAIAQIPNNPTIQQPNNPPPNNPPPPNNEPPAFVPKEERIIISPAAVMENPVSPILGVSSLLMLMLGIIGMAGFAANSFDERTQIVLAILVLLLTLGMGAIGVATQEPPPTTLDVPLRLQDPNTVFCGPALLGMAFDFINSNHPTTQPPNNQDIIRYMKENHLLYSFGTGVEELAYTARQQGYTGSFYFSDWTIGKLKEQIAAGRPILTPLQQNGYGQAVGHFVTVTGFSDDGNFVIVNDPLVGEKRIEVNQFNVAWQASAAKGVVVAPSPIPMIPESAAPLFAGVGAAAALAALAALGTVRKGLGAGLTEEEKDTWQNYSAPIEKPVDSWSNYVPFAPDPPDTWFDPPKPIIVETPQDRQIEENFIRGVQESPAPSSSGSSSHNEMTPDAGVNDVSSTQVAQTTEQGWGVKSDAELITEAEKEAAQRRKEIRTIEDAKKVAEDDANKALEAFKIQSSGVVGAKTVSSGININSDGWAIDGAAVTSNSRAIQILYTGDDKPPMSNFEIWWNVFFGNTTIYNCNPDRSLNLTSEDCRNIILDVSSRLNKTDTGRKIMGGTAFVNVDILLAPPPDPTTGRLIIC